jgi:hypothetical protein
MKKVYFTNTGVENLSNVSRAIRGSIGVGLIAFVMTTLAAPLGWYALLPLLAVYPIFTAIVGWDPAKAFFQNTAVARRGLRLSKPVRLVLGATGASLIGSVYVAAFFGGSLGLLALLPLIGIYPIAAAITGVDLITALYNMDNTLVDVKQPSNIAATSFQRPAVFEVIRGHKAAVKRREEKARTKAA